jgi:hypothetical protein
MPRDWPIGELAGPRGSRCAYREPQTAESRPATVSRSCFANHQPVKVLPVAQRIDSRAVINAENNVK